MDTMPAGEEVNSAVMLRVLIYKATSEAGAVKHRDPLRAAAWELTRDWLQDLAHDNWYPGNGDSSEGISY